MAPPSQETILTLGRTTFIVCLGGMVQLRAEALVGSIRVLQATIWRAVSKCIALAQLMGLSSIALPALGTGNAGDIDTGRKGP
jgi:O-acetyl-ADP-ribose deacetylase (regulator of RNase III)